ncbi:MAG TPA: Ig-like domain-containing protein, partial [Myxococcota bacterium]|nr:Ig-like domain-containing protein [Myxococcota bacterium]
MQVGKRLWPALSALSLVVASCGDGTVGNSTDLPPADTSDAEVLFPDVPDVSDTDTQDVPDTPDTQDVPDTPDTPDTNDTSEVDTADTTDTAEVDTTDTTDTTEVDTTPVDPCVPNPCTTPPDRCVGTVLELYTSPGTCTDDGGADCDYTLASSTDCAATNQVCSDSAKACVFPDLALVIESTSPAHQAVDIPDDAAITITFNQPMAAASLTAQTAAGPCSGNLQLSFDGFTSCVALTSSTASLSADGRTATLVPTRPLTWGLTYALRVGANVSGGNGRTLGSAQTFTFTTGPLGSCGGARVVISQVYGGGGSTGVFSHDFIELKNRTASPVSLAGWSLQYGSNSGTSAWSNRVLLDGVIPAGGYWLVQL